MKKKGYPHELGPPGPPRHTARSSDMCFSGEGAAHGVCCSRALASALRLRRLQTPVRRRLVHRLAGAGAGTGWSEFQMLRLMRHEPSLCRS